MQRLFNYFFPAPALETHQIDALKPNQILEDLGLSIEQIPDIFHIIILQNSLEGIEPSVCQRFNAYINLIQEYLSRLNNGDNPLDLIVLVNSIHRIINPEFNVVENQPRGLIALLEKPASPPHIRFRSQRLFHDSTFTDTVAGNHPVTTSANRNADLPTFARQTEHETQSPSTQSNSPK